MSFSFGQATDGRSSFSLDTSAAAPSPATTSSSVSSAGNFSFGATAGGVSTPSGAPSSGFSFGAATSKAPAAPATSSGFGFGTISGTSTSTATGSSASGFNFNGTSKAPSSGFSFSAPAKADTTTAAATSAFGLGTKPVADEGKATSGLNFTGAASTAPTLTTSTTPSGFNFGATSGTLAPVAATSEGTKPTTTSSGFSFGGASSTLTAPAASDEESKSEATTTSTLTVPSFGFGTSTATSGASGALTAATSTATTTAITTSTTTATSSPVAETEKPPAEYMGRTIEDIINAWSEQLERNADTFTTEAVKVSKWDSDLLDSQRKLGDIAGDVRRIQVAQNELDSNLDTIFAYQMELKSTLEQLEKSVDKMYESQHQMPVAADIEREQTLQLSVDLDDQLNSMTTTLKETVEKLNKAQDDAADENNPMVQIMKVLNVHHNSLQWIEGTTGRIDSEIAQLSSKLQKSSI